MPLARGPRRAREQRVRVVGRRAVVDHDRDAARRLAATHRLEPLARAVRDLERPRRRAWITPTREIALGELVHEIEHTSARPPARAQRDEIGDRGRARRGRRRQRERDLRGLAAELGARAREHRDVRAAEAVDRLLAIADDEEAVRLEVTRLGRRAVGSA